MTIMMMMISFLSLFLLLIGLVRVESLPHGDDAASFIQRNIDQNDVMVFAKSYCPFCKKTRMLLEELHNDDKNAVPSSSWSLGIIDLDVMEGEGDGALIQEQLLRMTGQRTVPNIFIGRQHIGGNSDLQELHASGQLVPKLEALATNIRDEI